MAKKPPARTEAPSRPAAPATRGRSADLPDIDFEYYAKKQAQLKRGGTWKMDGDEATIRLVPFRHGGKLELFHVTTSHFNPSPDVKVVDCGGPDCALCAVLPDLSKKEQNDLRPVRRCKCLIIDRANDDEGIQRWNAPVSVMDDMLGYILDPKKFKDVISLRNGLDFCISREGSGRNTKYKVQLLHERNSIEHLIKPENIPDLIGEATAPDTDQLAELADGLRR